MSRAPHNLSQGVEGVCVVLCICKNTAGTVPASGQKLIVDPAQKCTAISNGLGFPLAEARSRPGTVQEIVFSANFTKGLYYY